MSKRSVFDEDDDEYNGNSMMDVTLETQTDLGLEDEEFTDLDQIVIDKKYREMKERSEREKSKCCSTWLLCRLFATYDTHFLLSLGL